MPPQSSPRSRPAAPHSLTRRWTSTRTGGPRITCGTCWSPAESLPARDEALARVELWSREVLDAIDEPADRRLVQAYLTWQVLRRLRARSQISPGPRTPTGGPGTRSAPWPPSWPGSASTTSPWHPAARATWRPGWPPALPPTTSGTSWPGPPTASTATSSRSPDRSAGPAPRPAPASGGNSSAASCTTTTLDLTDRAAGCLLLLFGQHLSRIAVMTTSQIITRDGQVLVRFGQHEVPVPDSLGQILTDLIRAGRSHTGTGSPATSPWLFPGGMPGQPITPSRLGERLRAIGVRAMPGRRAAMTDLAAQLPAAVLADLLNITPDTAVRWMHQAGADWNRYAAEIARTRNHQP